MTNLEFYKEDIKRKLSYFAFDRAICEALNVDYAIDEYKLLDWLCEEHQILDKEEKEYLRAVIKPYRNRISSIKKCTYEEFIEYICIYVYDDLNSNVEAVTLPNFKKGCMYKGMELCKAYTLKDLGL